MGLLDGQSAQPYFRQLHRPHRRPARSAAAAAGGSATATPDTLSSSTNLEHYHGDHLLVSWSPHAPRVRAIHLTDERGRLVLEAGLADEHESGSNRVWPAGRSGSARRHGQPPAGTSPPAHPARQANGCLTGRRGAPRETRGGAQVFLAESTAGGPRHRQSPAHALQGAGAPEQPAARPCPWASTWAWSTRPRGGGRGVGAFSRRERRARASSSATCATGAQAAAASWPGPAHDPGRGARRPSSAPNAAILEEASGPAS